MISSPTEWGRIKVGAFMSKWIEHTAGTIAPLHSPHPTLPHSVGEEGIV
jgi:hypothetical protein